MNIIVVLVDVVMGKVIDYMSSRVYNFLFSFRSVIVPGKVVIVLSGRYAGRKAVVLRTFEEGTKTKRFSHVLVAGIDRYPRTVTNTLLKANKKLEGEAKVVADKKTARRGLIKPFVKFVNVQHIMPTRYSLDIHEDLSKAVTQTGFASNVEDKDVKKQLKKAFKEQLEARYKNINKATESKYVQGAAYFFRKLRF